MANTISLTLAVLVLTVNALLILGTWVWHTEAELYVFRILLLHCQHFHNSLFAQMSIGIIQLLSHSMDYNNNIMRLRKTACRRQWEETVLDCIYGL